MLQKLAEIKEKYNALLTSLSDQAVLTDPQKLKTISKEKAELDPIILKYDRFLDVTRQIQESREIMEEEGAEEELRELAQAELTELEAEEGSLKEELRVLLLPKDPNDEKDVFLEIRAGAGGDEASLFAQDLYRMYSRFAERKGWRLEVMSTSHSPIKGFKEIIVNIKGQRVYSQLKYESGVHRVQRVPETEASGRIHTSTVTVAVLPEAEDVDITLDPKDLRIDAFGASGPGGQSVNRNYSAIRVTHIPTNMVVSCQDEKSQHRNKEKALRILRTRLLDIAQREQDQAISKDRRSQVGTGERSEKIRTYNFPQTRVTDHRIGLTSHKLEGILDGELDEFVDALTMQAQTKAMATSES